MMDPRSTTNGVIHVVVLKNTLKLCTSVSHHVPSKMFADVNLILLDILIQKLVILGVLMSVPHPNVAKMNNGMNVVLVKRLNAVKVIIVLQTQLKHVQPFVNQDVNVLKDM
jgi:hypothetical protein